MVDRRPPMMARAGPRSSMVRAQLALWARTSGEDAKADLGSPEMLP